MPDFVEKTNNKIEEIYKKEQVGPRNKSIQLFGGTAREGPSTVRLAQKTTLASCLKEFLTLEKLSTFMESDHNLRAQCFCYQPEKDPSRTVLLDIITHRFGFMKAIGGRMRDAIYRCLLGRENVNMLTKINVQEYMRFCELFVGRDAGPVETATFLYLLLFNGQHPNLESVQQALLQLKAPILKQRLFLEQLFEVTDLAGEELIVAMQGNPKLLRLGIDCIIEK